MFFRSLVDPRFLAHLLGSMDWQSLLALRRTSRAQAARITTEFVLAKKSQQEGLRRYTVAELARYNVGDMLLLDPYPLRLIPGRKPLRFVLPAVSSYEFDFKQAFGGCFFITMKQSPGTVATVQNLLDKTQQKHEQGLKFTDKTIKILVPAGGDVQHEDHLVNPKRFLRHAQYWRATEQSFAFGVTVRKVCGRFVLFLESINAN